MRLLPVILLVACSSAVPTGSDPLIEAFGPVVPADAELPPPTSVTLAGPDFAMVSRDFTLRVRDALPEETVFIAVGGEEAPGPCRAWLGGYCMGMPLPLALAGRYVADGDGEVRAPLVAPPWPGSELCYQAVIRRGPAGLNSAFSEVHCVDFCSALDSDDDGVCDEYDICIGADEVDSDGDGLCDDSDPCPLDAADTDTDGDGLCDVLDPCPLDAPDDTDGDGTCDSDDICPLDPLDDCSCLPSGVRAGFNSLLSDTVAGCYDANPCDHDGYAFGGGTAKIFQDHGEEFTCSGPTTCVAHIGITTYSSTGNCQGRWDFYCDDRYVGAIDTVGRTCTGGAMSSGCEVSFEPQECSQITAVSVDSLAGAEPRACCGAGAADAAISSISAW